MCVTVWVLRYKNKKNGDRGTIVFTATLNHSEFVRARKRDYVSLTYTRLRLHSRQGCSDSEASNWEYNENIRLERRSNQGCHKTFQEGAGNWISSKRKELLVVTQKCRLHKGTPRQE